MGKKGLLRGGLGALLGKGAPPAPPGLPPMPRPPGAHAPGPEPAARPQRARPQEMTAARPRDRAPDAPPARGWRTSRPMAAFFASDARALRRRPAAAPARLAELRRRRRRLGPAAASAPGRSRRRATGAFARPGRPRPARRTSPSARSAGSSSPPIRGPRLSPPRPPAPSAAFAYGDARLDHRRQLRRPASNAARSRLARRLGCTEDPAPTASTPRTCVFRHPAPEARAMTAPTPSAAPPTCCAATASRSTGSTRSSSSRSPSGSSTPRPSASLKAQHGLPPSDPAREVGADRPARAAGRGGRPRSGVRAQVPELHHLGSDQAPREPSRKRAAPPTHTQGD